MVDKFQEVVPPQFPTGLFDLVECEPVDLSIWVFPVIIPNRNAEAKDPVAERQLTNGLSDPTEFNQENPLHLGGKKRLNAGV